MSERENDARNHDFQNGDDRKNDARNEGREHDFIDIDRMINEGLGGGYVTMHNGLIEQSTVDTMNNEETLIDESSVE